MGEGHSCFCTGRSRVFTGAFCSHWSSIVSRIAPSIPFRSCHCASATASYSRGREVSFRLTTSSAGRSSQSREKYILIGGEISIPDINTETHNLQRRCFSFLQHIARPNSDQGVATRSRARTALPPCFDSCTASVSPGAFLQLITGSSRRFSSCGRSDRCIVLPATLDSAVRIPYSSATC